jgi:CheY-like chemotaxis protein
MAVLGSLELLRKRLPDDPKMLALLENARQGAQRGTALTKRMLAFARHQELKKEAIVIPDLVRGMAELIQRSLGPSIRIETRFPLMLKPVQTDANQLEMAVLNLTVNARDAMPEGGEVVMTAREETVAGGHVNGLEPGRYICLTISDTGEGMDEATLKKAVEPFFTTKEIGKGTGLGLSMVHGFAEQSGGRFILRSRQGEGTSAELWLPVAEVAAVAAADQAADAASSESRIAPLKILVVDDDPLVLLNTVAMLEDLGHTAFAATSGNEALAFLRRDSAVDLVVTDQAMPHMTGIQLVRSIKQAWPDLSVLFATGYADMAADERPNLPQLSKPFTQAELAEALARMTWPPPKADPVVVAFRAGRGPRT